AADPPASPEPTTMMVYFRLLAGLISLISCLCLLHLSATGPAGIRPSSVADVGFVSSVVVISFHPFRHNSDWYGNVADEYHDCGQSRGPMNCAKIAFVADA